MTWLHGLGLLLLASVVQSAVASVEIKTNLTTVQVSPPSPRVGERISFFVRLNSLFERQEPVIEGVIGSNPLRLEQTGDQLWAGNSLGFSEIKENETFTVDIFLRDAKKSQHLRSALNRLKKRIAEINLALETETDLGKRAALEAERTQKQNAQSDLELELEQLKVFLKSESINFSVAADPSNPLYPQITSIQPNSSIVGKRVNAKISGTNFGINPVIKIGDKNATILSANGTDIDVLTPNFDSIGSKNIEIRFAPENETPRRNALLSSGFFVSNSSILENLRPVAVSTGYVRAVWPVSSPVVLNGANSYDENGDALTYSWEFIASPAGSIFPAGTLLPNQPNPTFLPDKLGIYRIRFRVKEASTEQEKESFPDIITVEVK